MLKVPYGQDPYSVIGEYIRDHITAIEDIIAVIEIDNITTIQLFMVDMNEENYFIWNNDWYEGENDVALIDFFPVSEAINSSAQKKGYTKADYIMALHKEYGCSLARAEDAHQKALEYLRNTSMMKG